MKLIILEDELVSKQKIESFVHRYDKRIDIALSTDSFDEMAKYLLGNSVDLILADIRVFDGNIFEKLSQHPIVCPFIFITAYDNYAFEALENYGIGYLLKPYTFKQFSEVMERFHRLNKKIAPDFSQLIQSLKAKDYRERIIIKSRNKAKILKVEDIQYFEIEDGVIFVFDNKQERQMISEIITLSALEQSLNPEVFFRINKSQIINLNAIKNFETYGKDRILIKIELFKAKLITSVNKTPLFRKWINQ
jgi:DNA-binding LytR/AlgR family response regulator